MSPADRALLRDRPPDRAFDWVTACIGAGARVDGWSALPGGISAAVHAVDVVGAGGLRHPLVLRRFVRADWLALEPDLAEREARVLEAIAALALPTPECVACDPRGERCDVPAVLMTRLPGRAVLVPEDRERWLGDLTDPLPLIHSAPDAIRAAAVPYRTWNDVQILEVPRWTRHPAVWERVLERVRGAAPPAPDCLIHRDYHPANLLFDRGRTSAVLDWVNASHGPPAIDLGHCRRNLANLHGPEVAERFLAIARERHPGLVDYEDPYWDLLSLIEALPDPGVYDGWTALGVSGLSARLIHERMDAYARSLVARI